MPWLHPSTEWSLRITRPDSNNTLKRTYVQGNELVSMRAGTADSYFHREGLGSVLNVTNSSGALQWSYGYEPFGSLRSEVRNDLNAPENLMRFTGQLFDVDPAQYHLRARQYDSGTGRFTSLDPVAAPLTDPYVAAYIYANNQPMFYVDPSGQFGWSSFKSFVNKVVSVGKIVVKVATGCVKGAGAGAILVGAAASKVGRPAEGAIAGAVVGCGVGIAVKIWGPPAGPQIFPPVGTIPVAEVVSVGDSSK